jgi:hypothetical protein
VAVSYDIRGQRECGIYKRLQEKEHRLFGRIFVCCLIFTLKKVTTAKMLMVAEKLPLIIGNF